MSTEPEIEVGVVEPVAVAAESGGGQQAALNPFFETFKEKFGKEVQDEDTLYTTIGTWKTQAELTAAREAEANEWKSKFETKAVEYRTPFAREVDAYAAKMEADGVPVDQIAGKIQEFWQQSQTNYRDMADKNPMALIEMQVRHKYAGRNLDDQTIADLVEEEANMPVAPDVNNFDDAEDPAYLKAKSDYDKKARLFKVRAQEIAEGFEKSKPKADFHPTGMKTPAEIEAINSKKISEFTESFNQFRDKFDGIDFAGAKVPFKLFDEKGTATPEFAPVLERMNAKGALVEFVDGLLLGDGDTPNPARIAHLMMLESPEFQKRVYERAKSDALKEFEANLRGNGAGFGGSAVVVDPSSKAAMAEWVTRMAIGS